MNLNRWILFLVGLAIIIFAMGQLGKSAGRQQAQEEIKQQVVVNACQQRGLSEEQCGCIYTSLTSAYTQEQIDTMNETGEYPEEAKALTLACVREEVRE